MRVFVNGFVKQNNAFMFCLYLIVEYLFQVCTYESMQAGLHHLKRMGVHKLTQPSGLAAAMNQLPDEAITIAAASHIERELQITPWNLSSTFVAATMQVPESCLVDFSVLYIC